VHSIRKDICGGSRNESAARLERVSSRATTERLDSAFAALADASRREILRLLLHKPRRAGELADGVDMSPQALSRHLRVLRKAGLVVEAGIDDDARVRIYSVQSAAFEPMQEWITQAEDLWQRQLLAFKIYTESLHRKARLKS
jgi:DNA-binding transcriptional ArsR family regulator